MNKPKFSHESGFYHQGFDLQIQADEGYTVYYTIDGSEPDPNNLAGKVYRYKNSYPATGNKPIDKFSYRNYKTYKYTDAINIRPKTDLKDSLSYIATTADYNPDYFPRSDSKLNFFIKIINSFIKETNRMLNKIYNKSRSILVAGTKPVRKNFISELKYCKHSGFFKATVVRAITVDPNGATSTVVSNTYFIGQAEYTGLPIISLVAPEHDLFSYDDGMLVAGLEYDRWLENDSDPVTYDNHLNANWYKRSLKTCAALAIFDKNTSYTLDVGIKMNGYGSRSNPNKSIRICPKKRYAKNGLDYDLFADGSKIGLQRVVLRNSGQDHKKTYYKDAVIHQIVKNLNIQTQRYRPFSVYLNGEYYGILNARDRYDNKYFKQHYAVSKKDLDYIKRNIAKTGDRNSWDSLINYIVSADKRVADFYTAIDSLIDIDNFIDYYIAHIFIANEDWPGNNIAHWRYKTENQKIFNSKYADGRWRWLFYDADMAADHVHYNSMEMATAVNSQEYQNPAWSTVVLRNLLENRSIRDKFITRFAYLLKNDFHPSNTIPIIKAYRDNIKPYIQIHIARWNNPKDISTWERYNNKLIYFF